MSDCIFCKIAAGEIPANVVYEDEYIICFHDLDPKTPVHVLIIPKIHMDSLNSIDEDNLQYVLHIMSKIKDIAKLLDIHDSGYRVVANTGADGGQTVPHLHFHLLGKRNLAWPPG